MCTCVAVVHSVGHIHVATQLLYIVTSVHESITTGITAVAQEIVSIWAVSGVASEFTTSLPSLTRSILSVMIKHMCIH